MTFASQNPLFSHLQHSAVNGLYKHNVDTIANIKMVWKQLPDSTLFHQISNYLPRPQDAKNLKQVSKLMHLCFQHCCQVKTLSHTSQMHTYFYLHEKLCLLLTKALWLLTKMIQELQCKTTWLKIWGPYYI